MAALGCQQACSGIQEVAWKRVRTGMPQPSLGGPGTQQSHNMLAQAITLVAQ